MKVKTLRLKESKEFVDILEDGYVYTTSHPKILPMTASLDALKTYNDKYHENSNIDYDKLEVIELEIIDSEEVGADIRNKLSPPNNLVALLETYFEEKDIDKKSLKTFILREMKNTNVSIDYLSKLF